MVLKYWWRPVATMSTITDHQLLVWRSALNARDATTIHGASENSYPNFVATLQKGRKK